MKLKNYVLLSVFYVFTILLVVYCCVIYKNSSKNVSDSNISYYVVDVTGKSYNELFNNISNYNTENSHFIIYVSSYKNDNVISFENIFKKVISDKNLKGKILYVNADNLKSFDYLNRFLNDFGFSDKINSSSLPIFIVIDNNKVIDIESVIDFDEGNIESIVSKIYD